MDGKKLNIEFDDNTSESASDHPACNLWNFQCGTLCSNAVKELLDNSVVTRNEIESFTNIIQMKDNQLKIAEDKLSALEIELSVYKERVNIYDQKMKDKDDLIAALSQNSTSIKCKLDKLMGLLSVKRDKEEENYNDDNLAPSDEHIKSTTKELVHEQLAQDRSGSESVNHDCESKIKELAETIANQEMALEKLENELKDKITKIYNFENQLLITIPYGYTNPLLCVPQMEPFRIKITDLTPGLSAILIQRRSDASVSFEKDFMAYCEGFGDVDGDFWLGLEKIHRITTHTKHCLAVYITDYQKTEYKAIYYNFVVAGKDDNYQLKSLGKYVGNAGDMMRICESNEFRICSTWNRGWWCSEDSISQCNPNGKPSPKANNKWESLYWGLKDWGSAPTTVLSIKMAVFPCELNTSYE